MKLKYEIQMWVFFFLKWIPGKIGIGIRRAALPLKAKGSDISILEGVQIDKPSCLTIGDRVSINRGVTINAGGGILIESDVLIGPGAVIYSQNHKFDSLESPISEQGYTYKKTTIKRGVWIGSNSIILPGVTVGEHSVIAAGSVVTKDVPSHHIFGGNPAKFIRSRI